MKFKPKFVFIDALAIRKDSPDFDIVESWLTNGERPAGRAIPYIPKGQAWFDRFFRSEAKFLWKVHRLERKTYEAGMSPGRARAYIMKRLSKKITTPYIMRVYSCKDVRKLLTESLGWNAVPRLVRQALKRNDLQVFAVRGDVVRRRLDPQFVYGGHKYRYRYVDQYEHVWFDGLQDPREVPLTIVHEIFERERMRLGDTYGVAHNAAMAVEIRLRRRKPPAELKPLKVAYFAQSADMCLPASLKIACAVFGREYQEKDLAKLCKAKKGYGTDHKDARIGAKKLGVTHVEAHANGTLADIRHNLKKGRPVIVGWMTDDGDHFSVVYHLTKTHVYVMDPDAEDGGRKRLTHKKFFRVWHDTDGPKDRKVKRWYMAVDFKKGR